MKPFLQKQVISGRDDLSLRYEYHLYRLHKPWWVIGDKISWDSSLFAVTAYFKKVGEGFPPLDPSKQCFDAVQAASRKKTNNPNLCEGMGERSQQILSSIWASANCLLLIVSYFSVHLLTSACPAALTSSKQAPLRPSWHFCFVYMVCPSGTKKESSVRWPLNILGRYLLGVITCCEYLIGSMLMQ